MMIERDIGKDEKKLSPKRWKRRKALESVVCLDFWVIHFLLFFLTLCPIQLLQYDIFHGRGGMREDSRWMNRIMGWSQMVEMEAPGGGDAWSWQKNFVKNSTREKDFLLLVCPEHFSCSGIFFYFVFLFTLAQIVQFSFSPWRIHSQKCFVSSKEVEWIWRLVKKCGNLCRIKELNSIGNSFVIYLFIAIDKKTNLVSHLYWHSSNFSTLLSLFYSLLLTTVQNNSVFAPFIIFLRIFLLLFFLTYFSPDCF